MSELEEKINAVLADPKMMQQLMSIAQSVGTASPQTGSAPANPLPADLDPAMLRKLSAFAGQTGIDQNQRTLLKALSPYLSRERIGKLEKAMRAAGLAKVASGFLNSGGFPL